MYIDFNYYSTTYKGKVKEADFAKLEVKASGVLNYYTFNRIEEVTENIKLAVCELVDNISEYENVGGKEISSESVGSYSVSYSEKNNLSNAKKQKQIIRKWVNSDLLYRGV